MPKPLFMPYKSSVAKSRMSAFMRALEAQHGLSFEDYSALHAWSVREPEAFWGALWEWCDLPHEGKCEKVLSPGEHFVETKWFEGVRLNFAECLLQNRSSDIAIRLANEQGDRRDLTYAQLYLEVAAMQAALRAQGVVAGDRVAGLMPNLPETVIAMLATTSLGALWSACSPDFGMQALRDRFSQIEPKVLVASSGAFYNGKTIDLHDHIRDLEQQLPTLEQIVIVPYSVDADVKHINNALLWEDFVDREVSDIEFERFAFSHPVYILYSSGTTGLPKCIVHGAGGTILQHQKELRLHSNLSAGERICFYTTCGWMMWHWLVSSLSVGAQVCLYDGSPFAPSPTILMDLIDEWQLNILGASAKYLSALENAGIKPIHSHDLASLQTILTTGSPLLPASFDYVYRDIKKDVMLSSISGGTDIISCFALGNPNLPVYRGQLQCLGLGMDVQVYNEAGKPVIDEFGELVCTKPFVSMPVCLWCDEDKTKYRKAYFNQYANVWVHGDYVKHTDEGGLVIAGRSDATLNPGGVRIGTAEIYRVVEKIAAIDEALVIGYEVDDDTKLVLFVRLHDEQRLGPTLVEHIKTQLHDEATPRHVPWQILQVPDMPRTVSGKLVEIAVREVCHGRPVKNIGVLANPESLSAFEALRAQLIAASH